MLSLTVYHIGMLSKCLVDVLQYGIVFFLVLSQLGKNKRFQYLRNAVQTDGYRIGRPYHRVQLFFLVIPIKRIIPSCRLLILDNSDFTDSRASAGLIDVL